MASKVSLSVEYTGVFLTVRVGGSRVSCRIFFVVATPFKVLWLLYSPAEGAPTLVQMRPSKRGFHAGRMGSNRDSLCGRHDYEIL